MTAVLQHLFFLLIVRPLVLIVLGLNIRHRDRLPSSGPAIVVSNHNSHLDTLVLMTVLPRRLLPLIRPVAAKDYFFSNPLLAWFSTRIMHIIPLERRVTSREDPFASSSDALERGDILILFPEGSRGDPEQMAPFKSGIAHLAKRHPTVPVMPVFLHGLGKALPKGEALLVPFFCDVYIGESIRWTGDRTSFMTALERAVESLAGEGYRPAWD